MEMFWKWIEVVVAHHFEYMKSHWIVHFSLSLCPLPAHSTPLFRKLKLFCAILCAHIREQTMRIFHLLIVLKFQEQDNSWEVFLHCFYWGEIDITIAILKWTIQWLFMYSKWCATTTSPFAPSSRVLSLSFSLKLNE